MQADNASVVVQDDSAPVVASFRAPAFNAHDPSLWFTIVEVNFKAQRITNSCTKFSHVSSLLPQDVLIQVSDDVHKAACSTTPYEDLKKAVLARLESSVSTRLQELLSKEELGNEKPSDLLRRMKRLLGDKYESFDQAMFSLLFYQRLPHTIQRHLFAVKNKLPLDDLAQLADDFMATTPAEPSAAVSSVTRNDVNKDLVALVSDLALKVSALEKRLDERSRQRSLSPHRRHPPSPSPYRRQHRSRSGSRHRRTPGVCFYHNRFGQDAKKCTQPCTFTSDGTDLNSNGGR